jgi:hypothetical protein
MRPPAKSAMVLIILGTVVIIGTAGLWLVEMSSVDMCLDRGGSWDYRTGECDFLQNHPYEPLHIRVPWMAAFPVAGAFAALAGFLLRRS